MKRFKSLEKQRDCSIEEAGKSFKTTAAREAVARRDIDEDKDNSPAEREFVRDPTTYNVDI